MKKITSILFITLSIIFCFKNVVNSITFDSYSFANEINDIDESENSEKSDIDENDLEEWQLIKPEHLLIINQALQFSYLSYTENKYSKPLFEITITPPELF